MCVLAVDERGKALEEAAAAAMVLCRGDLVTPAYVLILDERGNALEEAAAAAPMFCAERGRVSVCVRLIDARGKALEEAAATAIDVSRLGSWPLAFVCDWNDA